MIHALRWLCGRPVWIWTRMSVADAARLPRMSRRAIAAKQRALLAKAAWVGCVGIGGGITQAALYYGPGLVQDVIQGGGPVEVREAPVNVPEPASGAVLVVAGVALVVVRRRRQ